MRLTHDKGIGGVLPAVFARQTSRSADPQQQVGRRACGAFIKPGNGFFHHQCHGPCNVLFAGALDASLNAMQAEKRGQRVDLPRQLGGHQADGTDHPLKDNGNLLGHK
jgi:hypothetical protein